MLAPRHRLSPQQEFVSLHSTPLHARSSFHTLGMPPKLSVATGEEVKEVETEEEKQEDEKKNKKHKKKKKKKKRKTKNKKKKKE